MRLRRSSGGVHCAAVWLRACWGAAVRCEVLGAAAEQAGAASAAGLPLPARAGCSSAGAWWASWAGVAAASVSAAAGPCSWVACCGTMRPIRAATSKSCAAAAAASELLQVPPVPPLVNMPADGASVAGATAPGCGSSRGAGAGGCGAAAGAPVLQRNSSAARSSAPAAGQVVGGWRQVVVGGGGGNLWERRQGNWVAPSSPTVRRNAATSVRGSVELLGGASMFVSDGAGSLQLPNRLQTELQRSAKWPGGPLGRAFRSQVAPSAPVGIRAARHMWGVDRRSDSSCTRFLAPLH